MSYNILVNLSNIYNFYLKHSVFNVVNWQVGKTIFLKAATENTELIGKW